MQARPHDWSLMLIVATSPFCSTVRNSHKSVFGQESPMKTAISVVLIWMPTSAELQFAPEDTWWLAILDRLRHRSDWRIQQNVYTAFSCCPHRYPDGFRDTPTASTKWTGSSPPRKPSRPDKTIVLVMALWSRSSMDSMAKYLEANTEAQIVNFSYTSTRYALRSPRHSAMLQHLQDVQEVSFVCAAFAFGGSSYALSGKPSQLFSILKDGDAWSTQSWCTTGETFSKEPFTQSCLGQGGKQRPETGIMSKRNWPRFRIWNLRVGPANPDSAIPSFKVKTT